MFNDMNSDDDAQSEDLDDDTSTQSSEGDTGDSQRLDERRCSCELNAVLCFVRCCSGSVPGKRCERRSRHAERAYG